MEWRVSNPQTRILTSYGEYSKVWAMKRTTLSNVTGEINNYEWRSRLWIAFNVQCRIALTEGRAQ